MRDQFGHELFPGDCYLKGIYLQQSKLKNFNIKKFSILNYDEYLTPDEIFDLFGQNIKCSNHEQPCVFETVGKNVMF